MAQSQPASHEGELGKTPIAHLLVYAMERQLTGLLSLGDVGAEPTRVRLARGVPVKVKVGDRFALFGELLVEAGAIDPATLEQALATKGLLGDVLMLSGRVEKDILERVATEQFVRRIVHLFELGPAARFRYDEGSVELLEYGGEPANVDPLFLLWQGIRAHGSPSIATTIAALGGAHLPLHPAAPIARFGLTEDERLLVDHLAAHPGSVSELAAFDLVSAEQVERLVYFLAIVRAIDLGTGAMPVGVAPILSRGRTSSQVVAKVALRPMAHRQGAAAPDAPGDGERGPTRRTRTGSELAPVSAVRDPSPSELMQIACESTPMSTPEELIPTQVAPPRIGGQEPAKFAVEGELPPLRIEAPPASVSNAATLLSPKHPSLPPAVEPTTDALCALARQKLAADDLAGALDAAERAERKRPLTPEARELAAHVRSLIDRSGRSA